MVSIATKAAKVLMCYKDNAKICDLLTGKIIHNYTFNAPNGGVLSPSGKYLILMEHGFKSHFYNLEKDSKRASFIFQGRAVFNSSETLIATYNNSRNIIKVFDVVSGQEVHDFDHKDFPDLQKEKSCLSKDGSRLFLADSSSINVIDTKTNEILLSFPNDSIVRNIELSPDEKSLLVCSADGDIIVYRILD